MLSGNDAKKLDSSSSRIKRQFFMSLHRRMGIVSAFFVILLSLTGFVLHHSSTWNLDREFVSSKMLLGWYNIDVAELSSSYMVDENSSALVADALFFDSQRLPGSFNDLLGMVHADFGFVLATSSQLILVTTTGEVIEILSGVHGLPARITAIGKDTNSLIYLRSLSGITRVDFNEPSFLPENMETANIEWSAPAEVGNNIQQSIRQAYAESWLSWERLILDIHSGQVLGNIGVLLVDIMALLFVLMAITGVVLWARRRP